MRLLFLFNFFAMIIVATLAQDTSTSDSVVVPPTTTDLATASDTGIPTGTFIPPLVTPTLNITGSIASSASAILSSASASVSSAIANLTSSPLIPRPTGNISSVIGGGRRNITGSLTSATGTASPASTSTKSSGHQSIVTGLELGIILGGAVWVLLG